MSKKRPLRTSNSFRFTCKRIPVTLTLFVSCYLLLLALHRHYSLHAQIPALQLQTTSKQAAVVTQYHHNVNLSSSRYYNDTFLGNSNENVQFLGYPKISFLFLTRKALPLDFLWDVFFQTGVTSNFSIYVHSEPGFVLDNSTTVSPYFYGRQLNNSIKVSWGGVTMIEAEKLLLNAALQDPANQRFILLSESCVPLYNFSFIYNYIMSSPRSFLDSFYGVSKGRYNLNMLPVIPEKKWRKGSQWFTLIRKHAHLVASDIELLNVFRKHCKQIPNPVTKYMFTGGQNMHYDYLSFCIPDEHYIPTLFAVKEVEKELERRTLTYTSWSGPTKHIFTTTTKRRPAHPDTFHFVDADPKHIRSIKAIDNIKFETERRIEWCHLDSMPTTCFLFARKFSTGAAMRLLTSGILASDARTSWISESANSGIK